MRYLILNYEYPPVGSGGGVISKNIAEGLARLGNQVTVVSVFFKGLSVYQPGNPEIFRVKSKRKNLYRSGPLEMLSWVKKTKEFLNQYLKDNHYDICLANFTIPGGIVAQYIKKKYGIPYVIISHGHDIPWVKPYSMYGYYLLTCYKIKRIIKNAGLLFVQTEEMKTNAEKFTGNHFSDKIQIIPNGCDSKLFSKDNNKKSDRINILFSGRLVRQKNPMMFLKAIKLLKEKSDIRFKAEIYGDGPLRKKIERFIRKNYMRDIVSLSGKIQPGKMPEKYNSANIYVSAAVSEGMSIALLEAAFCRLYLIATPASGNRQIINSSSYGAIIPFNDFQSLYQEIVSFCKKENTEKHEGQSKSYADFINEYSWNRIVGIYQKHLSEIDLK